MTAATPDQSAQMSQVRQTRLLERWLQGGRLNLAELKEIRPVIGDDKFEQAIAFLGKDEAPAGAQSLLGRAKYEKDLSDYAPTYATSVRQIKRWIAKGKAAQPPELPPLDAPAQMRDWWVRHMRQRVPEKINTYALEAARGEPPRAGVDIDSLAVSEGDALRYARSIFAATTEDLRNAYKAGNDTDIERLQRRWKQSLDAVRLAESSERDAAKQSGDLIAKGEVFAELSQLIETLRIMRLVMVRKIRMRLADLDAALVDRIANEIEAQRRGEESVLRRLSVFRSHEELELELTEAAA